MTVLEDVTVFPEALAGVERPVRALVEEHLGADPSGLAVVSRTFSEWQLLNVHLGLEACVTAPGCTARLVGVRTPQAEGLFGLMNSSPDLDVLLTMQEAGFGAAAFVRVQSGPDAYAACLATGLLLLSGPDGPAVVWLRGSGYRGLSLEVLTPSVGQTTAFLDDFGRRMAEHNPFRGRFVRLVSEMAGNIRVVYERKPEVSRDEVILPDGVLEAVESHAIGISTRAERLAGARRHLKRGLLLYGPPGTGKTHTIRYLASQLPQATLFVLTGSGMGALDFVRRMVPEVAPVIVVLDDVDLIAQDRSLEPMAPRQMLFALLDAMDGIGEDADVLFVCTSNRADTLERAIAARPGRIDQAVEVGLPDADCRRRLLALYGKGVEQRLSSLDALVERTEGVTASFIKELHRRAWLRARAERSSAVGDSHFLAALDALLDPDNPLTPALLGVSEEGIAATGKHRGVGGAWCGI